MYARRGRSSLFLSLIPTLSTCIIYNFCFCDHQNPRGRERLLSRVSTPKTRALFQFPALPSPSIRPVLTSPSLAVLLAAPAPCPSLHSPPSMVASANYEQYSPFPRLRGDVPLELEGFQSSEEESELHSPVFDHPLTAFLPTERAFITRSPFTILLISSTHKPDISQ